MELCILELEGFLNLSYKSKYLSNVTMILGTMLHQLGPFNLCSSCKNIFSYSPYSIITLEKVYSLVKISVIYSSLSKTLQLVTLLEIDGLYINWIEHHLIQGLLNEKTLRKH